MGNTTKKKSPKRTSRAAAAKGKTKATSSDVLLAKNPWKKHKGLHKDDPLFDFVLAEIAEARRLENSEAND